MDFNQVHIINKPFRGKPDSQRKRFVDKGIMVQGYRNNPENGKKGREKMCRNKMEQAKLI